MNNIIPSKLDVLEISESDAQRLNSIYPDNTLLKVYENSQKFRIADGYTKFNDLIILNSGTVSGVTSVNSRSGAVTLTKSDVGLTNVDNTSDLNKPVSNSVQSALDNKEPTIVTGSNTQYIAGDKTLRTLGNDAILNQNTSNQTANYNISGSGIQKDLTLLTDGTPTGTSNTYITKNTADQANTAVSALYIYPTISTRRIYFGTSALKATVSFANVPNVEGLIAGSPQLTGTPTAITAIPTTNTTQIATTAFSPKAIKLTASGTGAALSFSIAHGIVGITTSSVILVRPNNSVSAGISYETVDATNVNIFYTVAPATGTNNLSYSAIIK